MISNSLSSNNVITDHGAEMGPYQQFKVPLEQ
jgi:hypothetical protein